MYIDAVVSPSDLVPELYYSSREGKRLSELHGNALLVILPVTESGMVAHADSQHQRQGQVSHGVNSGRSNRRRGSGISSIDISLNNI